MVAAFNNGADFFRNVAPVRRKISIADRGIIGRRDPDDDHRLFLAGAFEHALNVLYARVLQCQPALLDLLPQQLRLRRLPRRKIVIFRSRHRLKLGEQQNVRRAAQLFRFGQEPALHGKRAGGFIFHHHRCDRLFTDRPKALDRALCCLSAAQKEQVDAQRCEGRQRHIVGCLEVAHLLHGGRRRGQAEVLGNKVGIHVDPRGDLCDHVGSVEPLERLAAVGKLSLRHNHRKDFPDAAVIEHELLARQRQLRLQNERRKIVDAKALFQMQQHIDRAAHPSGDIFLVADSNKGNARLRVLGQRQKAIKADGKPAFHVGRCASGQPVVAGKLLLQAFVAKLSSQHFLAQRVRIQRKRLELTVAVGLDRIVMAGQHQHLAAFPLFERPGNAAAEKISRVAQPPVIRMGGKVRVAFKVLGNFLRCAFLLSCSGIALHRNKILHDTENVDFFGLHRSHLRISLPASFAPASARKTGKNNEKHQEPDGLLLPPLCAQCQ